MGPGQFDEPEDPTQTDVNGSNILSSRVQPEPIRANPNSVGSGNGWGDHKPVDLRPDPYT